MSKSVTFFKVGDTRRVRKTLAPAIYALGSGKYVQLHRYGSMECTEEWREIAGRGDWYEMSWHHDTLLTNPTLWERVVAFFQGKQPPIPRAVVIVDRKEQP